MSSYMAHPSLLSALYACCTLFTERRKTNREVRTLWINNGKGGVNFEPYKTTEYCRGLSHFMRQAWTLFLLYWGGGMSLHFSCNSKCMFILTSGTVYRSFVPCRSVPFRENDYSKKVGISRNTTLFRVITKSFQLYFEKLVRNKISLKTLFTV